MLHCFMTMQTASLKVREACNSTTHEQFPWIQMWICAHNCSELCTSGEEVWENLLSSLESSTVWSWCSITAHLFFFLSNSVAILVTFRLEVTLSFSFSMSSVFSLLPPSPCWQLLMQPRPSGMQAHAAGSCPASYPPKPSSLLHRAALNEFF